VDTVPEETLSPPVFVLTIPTWPIRRSRRGRRELRTILRIPDNSAQGHCGQGKSALFYPFPVRAAYRMFSGEQMDSGGEHRGPARGGLHFADPPEGPVRPFSNPKRSPGGSRVTNSGTGMPITTSPPFTSPGTSTRST
jgi:hypothetical protein